MPSTQDITLFSDRYWDRHAEIEDWLRDEGPVHQAVLPNGVGVWVITRAAEARTALADPRLSKDATRLTHVLRAKLTAAGQNPQLSGMFGPTVLFSDPPEHASKRAQLAAEFSPRRVAALRRRIERFAAQLVDALPTTGEIDLIAELAFPLPATVICELLGVPVADRELFRSWTSDLMEDRPQITNPASEAMAAYFRTLINARRRSPRPDLLSRLLLDGLSEQDVLSAAFLVFVAGHESTANLIGNAIHLLLADPVRWQTVAADPALVPKALDEVLRIDSPVRMATHRVTTEPVTYGPTDIPAGEIVLVCLGAASRDSRQCPRAGEYDITRAHGSHLAFGRGIHVCLGAALARLEASVALTRLTSRFPRARLADVAPPRRRSAIMNGFAELPVVLRTD